MKFRILDDDDIEQPEPPINAQADDSIEDEEITFKAPASEGSTESAGEANNGDVLTLTETVEFEDEDEPETQEDSKETEVTTEKEIFKDHEENSLKKVLEKVETNFVCDGTFLEFMIKRFKKDQSERQSKLDKKKANNRAEFQYDRHLILDVVNSQLKRLWQPKVDRETLYDIVQTLTKDEYLKIRRRLIIQQLYTIIREEKDWEGATYHVPGGAKLTGLQAKAFTLLVHLEPKMSGVIREMADFFSILTFATSQNGLNSYKLYQLANITRMLTVLLRHLGEIF